MQRLVALTQGLLLGWDWVAVGKGCSLVAGWLNACWGAWGLAWELEGQCPLEADMIGGGWYLLGEWIWLDTGDQG